MSGLFRWKWRVGGLASVAGVCATLALLALPHPFHLRFLPPGLLVGLVSFGVAVGMLVALVVLVVPSWTG